MFNFARSILFGREGYYYQRLGTNFYFTNRSRDGRTRHTSSLADHSWKAFEQYYLFTTIHEVAHAAMWRALLPKARPDVTIYLDGSGGRTECLIDPVYLTPIRHSIIRAAGHITSSMAAGVTLILSTYTFGRSPYRLVPSLYLGFVALRQQLFEAHQLVAGLTETEVDPQSDFGKIMKANRLHAAIATMALLSVWTASMCGALRVILRASNR